MSTNADQLKATIDAYVNTPAILKLTLKDRGTRTGLISTDSATGKMSIVAPEQGPQGVMQAVPTTFDLDEVEDIEKIVG
ncbi:MAG: hypothetical protein ABMA13_05505 [Chthoniobacteraceae bacterium]